MNQKALVAIRDGGGEYEIVMERDVAIQCRQEWESNTSGENVIVFEGQVNHVDENKTEFSILTSTIKSIIIRDVNIKID